MRFTFKKAASILVLAVLLIGVFAAPAAALTPKQLSWPVKAQVLPVSARFGYIGPRPIGTGVLYPSYARIAVVLKAPAGSAVNSVGFGVVYVSQPGLVVATHMDPVTGARYTAQYIGVTPSVPVGMIGEGEKIGTMPATGQFNFSVRAVQYDAAAAPLYSLITLPTNPRYQPLSWHFPSNFVDPLPLFK